ncbi:glycoside hydrolase family 32 protein, partial [uncultured Chitinophaga sp.]|uniref:glycoside hydrolase family 32 protein n=1 Tax=uncultured Chitinophaga sp. TaxID=339340 RepID=UPI0025D84281
MKHYCTSLLLLAALATQAQSTQTITVNKKWLALPVKNGGPKQDLELWADGKKITYINMELAGDNADWISYFDISSWKGKQLEVRTSGNYASTFKQSDADTNRLPLYKEALRGQFHFSPKRGWTNDPNGMVYYKGEYHLFFQHNPYGREWGNMTWGHAVSKDLLHWKEVGEALYPDATGTMYSGSAVADRNNTSGLGQQPMVMFYTSAGNWSQGMAWSTDGRTFHKLAQPAVPRINKDNRDPKVIWHAASKSWVMVVWVEREEGLNTIEFLRSPDLKNWTRTSVLNGGKGDDRYLYECPDLFELPTNGFVPEKKWVLTAANGQYAIGSFDGFTFKPEAERLNGQLGRDFYASQTFDAEPKGRRIEIGWWRTHTNKGDMNFNQAMSIPLELQLTLTKDGPRLTRMPVKELESLRTATHTVKAGTLKA